MNEIIQAMIDRRSVRKFTDQMPAKDALEEIIKAGLWAASGRNLQSSMIVAVTNRELRDQIATDNCKIGGWSEDFDPFYGAPVILIVLAKADCPTAVYDGSLTMGNMMLAAHSLGLGSIWIHRAREEFETPFYQNLLAQHGIEGNWIGVAHCAVGYVDGDLPKAPKRRDNRVVWIQ